MLWDKNEDCSSSLWMDNYYYENGCVEDHDNLEEWLIQGVLLVLAIALTGHLVHGQGLDFADRSDMETSRKLLDR